HSNNRIPPEGAIHLITGLKVNKAIKLLNINRSPIRSDGCHEILQSVKVNQNSVMETLKLSDIPVNQDFEDLYKAVKEIFPLLRVKHGGTFGILRKALS
uniref:Uncharacterized protein n=1 Tax=Xiphophorus couchianus TaxID=32473 RepID=A0A3B5LRD2_9TELE